MKLKSKHKKSLAYAAIIGGLLLFFWGAYLSQTLPPELPMSHPDWFSRSSERNDQDFNSFVCMGLGAFANVVAIGELLRQARKLKI